MKIDEGYTNFCRNIRYLRAKHHLSQQEMAKLLGIGVGTLRKMEQGMIPPRLGCGVLCRLAASFHVSANAMIWKDLRQWELYGGM